MRITVEKYFNQYFELFGNRINSLIKAYDFSEKNGDFGYKTQASAVFSSNIEGNSIDLNSFMNYKLSKEKLKHNKEVQEIEDLVSAYKYSQGNS